MGQPKNTTALIFFFRSGVLALAVALLAACREKPPSTTAAQSSPDIHTKVASLVPAATDLILGMGAADHLVAVSNYDSAEIGAKELPRVGDYQTTDWETLATLRPEVMIIQMDAAHLPEGFKQKAQRLGIQLLNVRLNTIADLLAAIPEIGRAIGEPTRAEDLAKQLSDRLTALQKKSAGQPKIKTLLTLDESGETLVGENTFLDDMLTAAGGKNAASGRGPWPKANSEILVDLKPDAVILLKPGAQPDTLDKTKQSWTRLPDIPAAKHGRIYLIPDKNVLLPGSHVADLAEKIYECLHSDGAPLTPSSGTPGEGRGGGPQSQIANRKSQMASRPESR